MKTEVIKFPDNFLWGSATAAHQVEGGNKNNDWYDFENKGFVCNKEVSGIAVDHYNRFEEDFDIAKSLNHNIHRFSIEWSRIEPEEGYFDAKEINHYKKVLEALEKCGMKSMVTLFHFTLPLWFFKKGGFEKKENVDYFIRFIEYVVQNLGKKIDFWITINEPDTYAFQNYLNGCFPARQKKFLKFLKVYENLSYTHNKAYKKIHEMISNAKVGISKNIEYFEPMRPSSIFDKSIVKIAEYLDKKWFLKKVKNNLDFLGVQYYFRSKLKFKLGGKYLNLFDECSISNHKVDGCERDDIGLEIYPEGIFHILMDLKKMNKPIIITENGVADRRDKLRERFIKDHLLNIHIRFYHQFE